MNNCEELSNIIEDCECNIQYNSNKLREEVFFSDEYSGKSLEEILRRATFIKMYADILIREILQQSYSQSITD